MKRLLVPLSIVFVGVLAGCGTESGSAAPTTTVAPAADTPAPVAAVISNLQHDLDVLDLYEGAHNGVFDTATVAALEKFQGENDVDASGAIDLPTSRALANALDQGDALQSVRALQEALADLGDYTTIVDGIFGPATQRALEAVQDRAGIDASGAYDPATSSALAAQYRAKYPKSQAQPTAPTTSTTTTSGGGSPTTTAPAASALLQQGDEGDAVEDLQKKLAALGYRPGTPDGQYGPATTSAVMAFEKHEGLTRDGVAGPEVRDRLAAPTGAGPKNGNATVPRVEIDLARQIMFVVTSDGTTILNTSTGSGERYSGSDGPNELAFTPNGEFTVQRKVDGPVHAPLGTLYKPSYFYQGWAFHGAASVPGYPASHGCARLSNADADWVFPVTPVGTPVIVYGPSTPNGPALGPSGNGDPGA